MSNSFVKKILNKKNTQKKYGKFKYITLSLLMIIALLSTSYAIFTVSLKGKTKYSITIGKLDFSIDNEQNAIRLMNAYPMSDEEGQTLKPYTFSLTNTGTTKEYYEISLITDTVEQASCDWCTFLSPTQLRYSLTVDGIVTSPKKVAEEKTLEIGELSPGQTKKYELRLWLNSEATIKEENKYYYGKIKVDASQEKNLYMDSSGANPPELTSGMIPVVYDEAAKTWEKADVTEVWYDYDNQVWANAVTVTEDTRASYMAADYGEPISMDDINTMWVWIPRYEYNYSNLGPLVASGDIATDDIATDDADTGKVFGGEIEINFIPSYQTRPSNSYLYQIPEGFKFGSENIPGFWIGKFETSTLESCTAANSSINTACDLTSLTPQIKPNVTSWRGARVSTFFEASRLMQSADGTLNYNADTYGFDTQGTSSMDSHMLKNTEWGIVAMLSHSRYGKYGNINYTGTNKEVYQNKSSSHITGMSNGTPSQDESNTQLTYDTPDTGYGASTTGTIYGVYDMSGGALEYAMGSYNNYSGNSTSINSGFCGTNGPTDGTCREWPNTKYYDLYTSDISSEAYKFGDATAETESIYSDYMRFAQSYYPWFVRGGYYDGSASVGVFFSGYGNGNSSKSYATRFVIKP